MQSNNKYVIAGVVLAIITAFAVGRWTAPSKTTSLTQTNTQTDSKSKTDKDSKTDTNRDKHIETTTTEVTHPDGTKETTTKTVQDTGTEKKTEVVTHNDQDNSTSKSTLIEKSVDGTQKGKLHVSLLGAMNIAHGLNLDSPDYGAAVSKDVLGPVSVGLFGLKSGILGASVGLSF